MLDTRDRPQRIRDEIVSTLEFEHRTTVNYLAVLTQNGKRVAVHDRKEKKK